MGQDIRSPRVLVVEDEGLMRWSLLQTLADMGCSVEEAVDGEGAIRNLSRGSGDFDVILLDYQLPDSRDLTLLGALRRLAPRCQIILMTAFGTPDVLKVAVELGVYRVLAKPFELRDLAQAVRQAYAERPQ